MPEKTRRRSGQDGYTLVEMTISSGVMLLVLAGTVGSFSQALRAHDTVTLLADSNQSLRAGTAFVVRDLMQAGNGIPTGGIPIPSGAGSEPVKRPGPPGTGYSFDAGSGVLPAVSPGPNMGAPVNGAPTDMLTMIYLDNRLDLDAFPLVDVAGDGSSAEFDAQTDISDASTGVKQGDLIVFSNAVGYAMREVTSRVGQRVYFDSSDVSNLNQGAAAAGTIQQLQTAPNVYPPTYAFRVRMVSYYLDSTTDPDGPRLVRQENFGTPRALAGAVEDLQVTYDLVDGLSRITDVDEPELPHTPHQIRKVNLQLGVRAEDLSDDTRTYRRGVVSTQVSLRSLAYVDRYE